MEKRILSTLLAASMMLSSVPTTAFAVDTADGGLCAHHTEHTAECHYAEAVEGQPCTHIHSEDCYAILECLHTCRDECADGCTHVCEVKVDSADSCYKLLCYKLLCSHKDGGHDDACGYLAAVEAHDCQYKCGECFKEDMSLRTSPLTCVAIPEGDAENQEIATSVPDGDLLAMTEKVCDCGTDDESIHATTCAVYVAPENPRCYCAEKCTETNIWCDVCGFDYTACSGTDTAAAFEAVTGLTIGNVTITETGMYHVPMGGTSIEKVSEGEEYSPTNLEVLLDENGGYMLENNGALTSYRQALNSAVDITLTSGDLTLDSDSLDLLSGNITVDNGNLTIFSYGSLSVGTIKASGIVNIETIGNDLIVDTLDLSASPHVVISEGYDSISITNISGGNGLYRTSTDGAFSDTAPTSLSWESYFEYIRTDHLEYAQNTDGLTHSRKCSCSLETVIETEDCSGGTATCEAAAVCSTCSESYGSELGHAWSDWTITETQHSRTCGNDNTHVETADHSTTAEGDKAATCNALAYCSVCQSEYGELAPDNHVSDVYTYTDNGDGTHSKVHECGVTVGEPENHTHGTPSYSWTDDPITLAVTVSCTVCDETFSGSTTDMTVTTSEDGFTTYTATVTLDGKDYTDSKTVSNEVTRVNITWGTMDFTYTDESGWNNPDTAWVQVENTGTTSITASATYASIEEYKEITGTLGEAKTLAANEEGTFTLTLSGKPNKAITAGTIIGSVTVKIEAATTTN